MDGSFVFALCFNVLILVPVVTGLLRGSKSMDQALGPDTASRRILTSVYANIALASILLIALHLRASNHANSMTLLLFFLQVGYKIATVFLVGVSNPVVQTNLVVVAVQVLAVIRFVLRNKLLL